jgi:hypothetical protein
MSLGISEIIEIPKYDIKIDAEIFRYVFIFNDPWLDFDRQGVFLGLEQIVVPQWTFTAIAGYYNDNYEFPRVRTYSCETITNTAEDSGRLGGTPLGCNRKDTGTLYQLGLYWNWTQFQRLSLLIQYATNDNSDQKEFNRTTQSIELMYTMAFPSVKRVSRIIDRFADSAFTKGGR